MKIPAVLLITHGSRESSANREFFYLVRRFSKRHPGWNIRLAFLENANPSIFNALKNLSAYSNEIEVLPLFIFAAQHLKNDIPKILEEFRANNPNVVLRLGKELGSDPQLARIALQRMKPKSKHPNSTVVLLLGRGSRDPKTLEDFQIQVQNFSRLRRFKQVLSCYFEAAQPSLEQGLEAATQFNPKKIVIVPYLLFKGSWQKRVKSSVEAFLKHHPNINFWMAPPLGFHPVLIKILDQKRQTLLKA